MSLRENSPVWIYAIAANVLTSDRAKVVGIQKQPIQWIVVDELQIAVSADLGSATTIVVTEQAFLEYERAICELCSDFDCLPVRFGTKLSMHQARDFLSEGFERFKKQLKEYSGCCELSIRWAIPTQMLEYFAASNASPLSNSPTNESGTSYLKKRREESRLSRVGELLASETAAKLQELFPESIRKVLSSARKLDSTLINGIPELRIESDKCELSQYTVIEVALLVIKNDAEVLKKLLCNQMVHSHSPTVVNGPWPIYSFVGK